MKTNQLQFTEKAEKELRNQYIGRVEVLEKVKELFLIPDFNMMTATQISKFYEVDIEVFKKCYQRNKIEIDNDGTTHATFANFVERWGHDVPFVKTQTNTEFSVNDEMKIVVPNRGVKLFSKRAILRIGMLLRDSRVAKEIRTQLLNTFENSSNEVKVSEINEELAIQKRLGEAMFSGDANKITEVR